MVKSQERSRRLSPQAAAPASAQQLAKRPSVFSLANDLASAPHFGLAPLHGSKYQEAKRQTLVHRCGIIDRCGIIVADRQGAPDRWSLNMCKVLLAHTE